MKMESITGSLGLHSKSKLNINFASNVSHGFLAAQRWNSAKAEDKFPALFLERQRQNIQHLIRQYYEKANRFSRIEK